MRIEGIQVISLIHHFHTHGAQLLAVVQFNFSAPIRERTEKSVRKKLIIRFYSGK